MLDVPYVRLRFRHTPRLVYRTCMLSHPDTLCESIMADQVIITGACGFVGAHLAVALARLGLKVIATDIQPLSGPTAAMFATAGISSFVQGDLNDTDFVDSLLRHGGGVIHAAGSSRQSIVKANPPEAVNATVGTTTLLLGMMRQYHTDWFILLSSRDVERFNGMGKHAYSLDDVYALLKQTAEDISHCYCMDSGIPLLIYRLSDVYGSALDHPGKVLPIFIRRAREGLPLHVYEPTALCYFTHIHDVVAAICEGVTELNKGRTSFDLRRAWNLPGITILKLAQLIKNILGNNTQLIINNSTHDHVSILNNKYIPQGNNFIQKITLEDGLRKLLI
ncbi:MAG: hypothetical protein BWK76_14540 [Desulfobulbaceae bacterium A2]|nr:MAG: hypothetical protein BWK76_14540 [Desulfobulbaceae bacterium A2]